MIASDRLNIIHDTLVHMMAEQLRQIRPAYPSRMRNFIKCYHLVVMLLNVCACPGKVLNTCSLTIFLKGTRHADKQYMQKCRNHGLLLRILPVPLALEFSQRLIYI